jgi:hypothetical protein
MELGSVALASPALASPALATNEQYRFSVPATATAGTTLTDIKGHCAGSRVGMDDVTVTG